MFKNTKLTIFLLIALICKFSSIASSNLKIARESMEEKGYTLPGWSVNLPKKFPQGKNLCIVKLYDDDWIMKDNRYATCSLVNGSCKQAFYLPWDLQDDIKQVESINCHCGIYFISDGEGKGTNEVGYHFAKGSIKDTSKIQTNKLKIRCRR